MSSKEVAKELVELKIKSFTLDIFVMIFLSIFVTVAWNRLAPVYLYFLPIVYHHFSYWNIFGIYIVSIFIGSVMKRLTSWIFNR